MKIWKLNCESDGNPIYLCAKMATSINFESWIIKGAQVKSINVERGFSKASILNKNLVSKFAAFYISQFGSIKASFATEVHLWRFHGRNDHRRTDRVRENRQEGNPAQKLRQRMIWGPPKAFRTTSEGTDVSGRLEEPQGKVTALRQQWSGAYESLKDPTKPHCECSHFVCNLWITKAVQGFWWFRRAPPESRFETSIWFPPKM